MRNGKQQREARRDNFRQMELDAASRSLAEAGYGQRQDLSLATRIEVVLHNLEIKQRQAEMKLSLRELEINMARTALLGALGQEDDGQVKLDDLLQALIISRNLAKSGEADARLLLSSANIELQDAQRLLGASHSLAHDRGMTIRTLERRIAANFQDESLAVRQKDEEIAELDSTLAQARAGYDSFVAVSIQQAERIKELEAQLASRSEEQLVDITVHGDVLLPVEEPGDVGS